MVEVAATIFVIALVHPALRSLLFGLVALAIQVLVCVLIPAIAILVGRALIFNW